MKEVKQLSGILNTDDSNEVIGATHHKMAVNGRFRNGRFENILGTNEITYTKPSGTNEVIYGFYDDLKNRIFFFNWNSNGNHGIYQYIISTGVTSHIILVGTNTDGDILNWDRNNPIFSAKILYGDTVQGDELWFCNSQKQPCKINIDRALSGDYGAAIERSFISVNFAPPIMPPYVAYSNDATVTVNNLRKKLFKFKIRFVNKQNNKSVTSIQSEVALPQNYADTLIDKDPTKNSRIDIVFPTGSSEVKKIELLVATSTDNQWGDFELVTSIDKALEAIPNNDLSIFRFYNNQVYTPIDPKESIQLFDLVPLEANDLEFLNGNVPIFCGIKEGYNPVNVTSNQSVSAYLREPNQNRSVFKAVQSGNSIYGSGNIHIVLVGGVSIGQQFDVNIASGSSITFTATVATTTNVIDGLATAATSAGFTIISSDSENLVIFKTNTTLQLALFTPIYSSGTQYDINQNQNVFDWNSRYSICLQYFDENGITCGSLTNKNLNFQTTNYTEISGGLATVPKILFEITNRPPLEAKYFTIGRSKNLTKQKYLYWVSDRTFKDAEFAYIGIENLNTYIKNNPSSAHLAYDFSKNDRIRFVKCLSNGADTIYTDQDFEIQAQIFNEKINGVVREGQFLKIPLPATSGTFDFGTSAFYNYTIQLYTPALSSEVGDTFFEFGQRFAIGNAGLSTRFHQGLTQNQAQDLSAPALFEYTKGDAYARTRKINTGAEYNYNIFEGTIQPNKYTLGITFLNQSYSDANIIAGSSILSNANAGSFNIATNNDRFILKIVTGNYQFRIKGSVRVSCNAVAQAYSFALVKNTSESIVLVPNTLLEKGIVYVFNYDVSFSMTSTEKIFFLGVPQIASVLGFTNKTVYESSFTITRDLSFTNVMIDENFSNFYPSKLNSNGRAFIVDVNAKQSTYNNLFRWGLARQFDSNINQTNRFYEQNATEVDLSKGALLRMKVRQNELRFWQERGVGRMGIYSKFLQSNNGGLITSTDEIINKNNHQYYVGEFGLGNQPTSLIFGKTQDYFIDPINGYELRVAGNGITSISEIYKGQFLLQPLFTSYNKTYLRPNGTKSKILGYFDYAEEESVRILQGGTLAGNPNINNYAYSFNETRNAYCGFFDFNNLDWIISAADKTYAWKDGGFHIFNNTTNYCNFFGTQYFPKIRLVFNGNVDLKKMYNTTAHFSNKIWSSDAIPIDEDTANSIITSWVNQDTNIQQISELKEVDYTNEEGKKCAAFLRDKNSGLLPLDAVLEGDFLQGNWIEIEYIYKGSQFCWLYLPQISWQPNNRNY